MILKRSDIERREKETLAPYAALSAESRGREFPEAEDPFRTAFQRDRDRIIHSKAFRRLQGKTQVFVAHYGDHYRSRLAHSMEVAQLSRDMARNLGLNEDLAEAVALAHDLGHTPFGHAGQETLDLLMREHGLSFEHNEQSRRIVTRLEQKNPGFPGLNLTFELRDGLMKHRDPSDPIPENGTARPSLESQLVDVADKIAYLNHDIDDGIRARILSTDELNTLPIWKQARETAKGDLPFPLFVSAMISRLITLMVNDLMENTDRLLKKHKIRSLTQVNATPEALVAFSDAFAVECRALKAFLFERFYNSPGIVEYNKRGQEAIRFLFYELQKKPSLIPEKFSASGEGILIQVKDHIASMTDDYAMDLYDKLHWKAFSRLEI
jgi:dGTPase